MPNKVALILGYGPHVGVQVASTFASKDYKIAVVSRSDKHTSTTHDYLFLQADLSDPASVEGVFATVVEKLGHPSVVVYNAAASSIQASLPLHDDIASFQMDYNVNVVSAYIAANLAVMSFNARGANTSGTYIYTGNKLNFIVVPPLLSQGICKAGAAHMMNYLAEQYKDHSHKFYYADEREPDGTPVYSAIDGSAHGEFYAQLADENSQGAWLATFVKGQGYIDFHEAVPQKPGALPVLLTQ